MIDILKRHLEFEYNEAEKALGMEEKILMLRDDVAKSGCVNEQDADPALKEKIRQLKDEFNQKLPIAPNYNHILNLLRMLKDVSRTKTKLEIKRKLKEVMDQQEVKQKIDALEAEMTSLGVSDINSNPALKEKALQLKSEVHSEAKAALESLGLQVQPPELVAKVRNFKEEVKMLIDEAVNSSDMKNKIKLLKAEAAKAGNRRTLDSVERIHEIKLAIAEAIWTPELKEKQDKLNAEIAEAAKSSVGTSLDGNSNLEDSQTNVSGQPKLELSEVKVNQDGNRSLL